MYLCQKVKSALQLGRVLKVDVIRQMHTKDWALSVLEAAGDIWGVHKVAPVDTHD